MTTNRPMNLAMLQSVTPAKFRRYTVYRQYLLIKAEALVCCTECSETQVATCFWLINANSLHCSLRRAALRLHQVVRNVQTTQQSPNKPVNDVTFALSFCALSEWLPANIPGKPTCSGVLTGGGRASRPPGKLNAKTGPPLVDIDI